MVRCVLALAWLTVRDAARSRVVGLLAFGICLAVLGVPLALRSDGTPTGHVQLLLYYSLGFAGLMLSFAAVWAGAGAVAFDVENKLAPMLVCKPVHAWQLCLGKWLGLLFINGALLAAAGVLSGLALAWSIRGAAGWSDADRFRLAEEILVARRVINPEPEHLTEAIAARVADLRKKDKLPEGPLSAAVSAEIERDAQQEATTIAPGGRKTWFFNLQPTVTSGKPLSLRFRFEGSSVGPLEEVSALWEIAGANGNVLFRHKGEYAPGAVNTITIPFDVADAAAGRMIVSYGNVEPRGAPTVVFPLKNGISLHAYAGAFLPNYLRALLVMFCRLAILAAFGLSMGCCFSFPVASFVTFSLLLFAGIENWSTLPAEIKPDDGIAIVWRWPLVEYLLAGLDMIIAPLYRLAPLSDLSAGLIISWDFVLRSAGDVLLYAGVLLLVGAILFRRRELGLFT